MAPLVRTDPEQRQTIHVYSPPLQRRGAYVIDETGALLRTAQDGEEELRPQKVA